MWPYPHNVPDPVDSTKKKPTKRKPKPVKKQDEDYESY